MGVGDDGKAGIAAKRLLYADGQALCLSGFVADGDVVSAAGAGLCQLGGFETVSDGVVAVFIRRTGGDPFRCLHVNLRVGGQGDGEVGGVVRERNLLGVAQNGGSRTELAYFIGVAVVVACHEVECGLTGFLSRVGFHLYGETAIGIDGGGAPLGLSCVESVFQIGVDRYGFLAFG